MDNNSKYEFLTQLAVRMVDSIDGDMLQNNVARLAEFDEKGTSISPQLMPSDPEFPTFFLFYLLLTRITRFRIQQLTVQNPEVAAHLVKKLTMFCNVLKNGCEPFSVTDFCSLLTQGLLPADSSSLSGGFVNDEGNLSVPVDKMDLATRILPDILFLSANDSKVKTPADMAKVGIGCLEDTIKYSKTPPVPDKPTIIQKGDHLEFPI
jgi:hypothetical protein